MKIALCFFGQPRFIKECFDLIKKNILDINNVDIFVHTWFSDDILNKKLYSEKISSFSGNAKIEKDAIYDIEKLYNPKKIIVEKPIPFINKNLNWGDSLVKYYGVDDSDSSFRTVKMESMYSLFYSRMKSVILKKEFELSNNFKYDLVIMSRFDNIFLNPIIFSDYDPELLHYQELGQPDRMISDWINFSSSENIDCISTIFQLIEKISKICLSNYNAYSPESLIRAACDIYKIETKSHYLGIEIPKHGEIKIL